MSSSFSLNFTAFSAASTRYSISGLSANFSWSIIFTIEFVSFMGSYSVKFWVVRYFSFLILLLLLTPWLFTNDFWIWIWAYDTDYPLGLEDMSLFGFLMTAWADGGLWTLPASTYCRALPELIMTELGGMSLSKSWLPFLADSWGLPLLSSYDYLPVSSKWSLFLPWEFFLENISEDLPFGVLEWGLSAPKTGSKKEIWPEI